MTATLGWTSKTVSEPTVKLYDLHPPLDDFRSEAIAGLQKPEKFVSAKFLYDKRGSELFDAICNLEEYYVTRTEMSILQTNAVEIAAKIGDGVLVEFGSGSSQKVRIILDAMEKLPTYVALDISVQHLYESCVKLAEAYVGLEAIAICTDYTQPIKLPEISSLKNKHKVAFFPGSSVGNLEPEEVIQFLKNTANLLEPNSSLLIGVDLKKNKSILEPAYDDSHGISAAFALNLLTRINRELGANFNLDNFGYKAFYNAIGRIEMYIVSLKEQVVNIDGIEIHFQAGELLRTEYSYKYTITEFQELAAQAGFQPQQVWTDPQNLFSLHYLTNSVSGT
ncbi:L-histidine N(alpha)-methyltransferase [Merismopedia glauca]|uniref:L-histidine N(Alpha)-methyltransferase n=1 Tax=Merismopedia glauca CCAP 1448/3 TaxID=1296344 RepID=A0A2T1BXN3_9CYAN|nr:L-histidine N(alpha)-methyltransferase [Merismopedia glauca]PSB00776.1 L-histidine N(alpha)-methyltransferase [Merismopedia glauca CCAP 1448/3]